MARIARTDTLRPVSDERPIFIPDGDLLIPQPEAAGPWFPGVQHGGAIAALVARAVEAVPSAVPMVTTRLMVDMSRRVPMGPTKVEAEVVRDGLRLQAVECQFGVPAAPLPALADLVERAAEQDRGRHEQPQCHGQPDLDRVAVCLSLTKMIH